MPSRHVGRNNGSRRSIIEKYAPRLFGIERNAGVVERSTPNAHNATEALHLLMRFRPTHATEIQANTLTTSAKDGVVSLQVAADDLKTGLAPDWLY